MKNSVLLFHVVKVLILIGVAIAALQLFLLGAVVIVSKIIMLSATSSPGDYFYPVYSYFVDLNERFRGPVPVIAVGWFFIVLLRFIIFPGDAKASKVKLFCNKFRNVIKPPLRK